MAALAVAAMAAVAVLAIPAMIVGAVAMDPVLVLVTQDGWWIEIDRWWV